jgi:hypothetical protein
MTREEKDLVLQDLCARLPYSPICHIIGENGADIDDILTTSTIQNLDVWVVKPYLRPMSSMTEEERDYVVKHSLGYTASIGGGKKDEKLYFHFKAESFDWLNAHHFDYRGLIDKGLAIKVTEGNNPYKD